VDASAEPFRNVFQLPVHQDAVEEHAAPETEAASTVE
jgi:hypothetical protein